MKEIAVLGCTGSIGTQTLDVIRLHKERFHAAVLAARKILICFCGRRKNSARTASR